ncbi:MAG: DNA pilot protein [Microviridae sp.]|nr:MAG: DNA pilot protein [Microviridae sp.]
MSIFKKIGKFAKKILPIAAGAGAAAFGLPAISGLFSAKDEGAQSFPVSNNETSPTVNINGTKPSTDWLSMATPIASGALNYIGQRQTNAANAQQAQQQMDFQSQQSSTSYQRATADMQKAGLNPMLAYQQGGAGFGAGSSATMANEIGEGANSALSSAQTLQALRNASAQHDNITATTENIDADTEAKRSQVTLNAIQGKKLTASAGLDEQTTKNATKTFDSIVLDNALKSGTLQSNISSAKSGAQLRALDIPKAQNEAGAQDSWWKRNISPYLHDIGSVTGSAASAARILH